MKIISIIVNAISLLLFSEIALKFFSDRRKHDDSSVFREVTVKALVERCIMSTEYKTIRRKFTQSILKWSSDDLTPTEEKPTTSPDVGDLVNILRSVGFKCRQFEMCENKETSVTSSTTSLSTGKCRVEIMCGHSGLKAILESVAGECRCPPAQEEKPDVFWHVSGNAPMPQGSQESLNSVQEAGSSRVPELPPAVGKVVKEVMSRILALTLDPKTNEFDTSSRSLSGIERRDSILRRSLDALSISENPSKLSSEAKDHSSTMENPNKTAFTRTLSNIELPTCPLSPVDRPVKRDSLHREESLPTCFLSPVDRPVKRDSLRREESFTVSSPQASPVQELTVRKRNSLYCRLEVAKRSITEAMGMLDVNPLSLDKAKKKMGLAHTSTPSRLKVPSTTVTTATPRTFKKPVGSPSSGRKILLGPGSAKRPGPGNTPGNTRRTGTPSLAKRTPVASSSLVRTTSSMSLVSTKSEPNKATTPAGRIPRMTSLSNKRKATETPVTSKTQAGLKTPKKSDVSSGSSSSASASTSASSATSSKARTLKSVVRKVSQRLSGSNDTPRSKT